jgi:hypothetical protein
MDGKLPNYSVISPVRNMLKWERRDNMKYLWFTVSLISFAISVYCLAIGDESASAWMLALSAMDYAFYVEAKCNERK